jgi:2-dehydro-3-deoxyphosphogluconate aldolase / (4S)-4-hydroxy-2-oxoglutarate aldolase
VSPGSSDRLLDAMAECGVPFLSGVSSASDLVRLVERGITSAKFFPAEASGGVAALRALAGPFHAVRFCPTGGITAELAPRYLATPGVACVGGTWVAPGSLQLSAEYAEISRRAAAAASMRPALLR